MDNAADAVADIGEPQIDITILSNDKKMVIEIRDNGCSNTTEAQTRLFEPFFATKGVGKGIRLGIVDSYRIV